MDLGSSSQVMAGSCEASRLHDHGKILPCLLPMCLRILHRLPSQPEIIIEVTWP